MYKLILVDDEEEVRKGILNRIDWGKIGYEVAGEAENGLEALEIADKLIPDVIITDIKMPFMDGIELSERMRERFPAVRIIILTGFDEFDYAKKAIKLNIEEYLLKPISANELMEVLINTKDSIDAEIEQKKDMEVLKEHYIKSLPLLREKFLNSLISKRMDKTEIISKSNSYRLNLDCTSAVVSVISIDWTSTRGDIDNGFKDTCIRDKEIIRIAAHNLCEETIAKYSSGIAFLYDEYIVIIYTSPDDSKKSVLARLIPMLDEIRMGIERYYGLASTAGVGTFCCDITNISSSYESAITALDYRLTLGGNRVICIEDVEPLCANRVVLDDLKERTLISSIKVGGIEEIEETINNLLRELVDARASFKDCQVYLLGILTAILRTAQDLNVDMDRLFGDNYNLFVEIYKLKDIREIRDWLINICTRIRSCISKGRQDACKLLVKDAKEYLQKNYNDSDMNIDKICSHLHISPTYFSTIFKKETGFTFLNYLTSIRMEAARELLRSTGMKAFEIAGRVGYSEPNYFSYCFKKHFSVSPSEYRKKF